MPILTVRTVMSVDYSLLHRFRISQRRELAVRAGRSDGEQPEAAEAIRLGVPGPACVLREALGGTVVQILPEDR